MENDFRTHGEHSAIDDEGPMPLPLSAAFAEAAAAVIEVSSMSLPNSLAFARAAVRIEVSAIEGMNLMSSLTRDELSQLDQPDFCGPMMRDGIAIYIVPYLPEPGWRVINPANAR